MWQQFSSGHGANVPQTGVNTTHVRSRRKKQAGTEGMPSDRHPSLPLFWDTCSPWESKVNPRTRGSKWDGYKRERLAMVSGAWEVVLWAPSHFFLQHILICKLNLNGSHFNTIYVVLKARILKWVPIQYSSGPHLVHFWMLSNYGVGEDSWESLEQQRDQTSQP